MQTLFQTFYRLVERVSHTHQRYLYHIIDWDERLIGIKGARGVGKTTMVLQHIRHAFPDRKRALYVSLDQLWFTQHTILELAEYHYTHGGTHLFLDEVHRYPGWIRELKNIYDSYPDLHVVFIGSSLLELDNSVADLSRRCRMYSMRGLSFREYLAFENVADLPVLSLEETVNNHVAHAASITGRLKVLPRFEEYLSHGYYPFYNENDDAGFYDRLRQVVTTIIENDVPAAAHIEYETILKAKRLVVLLAEMVPFTLNISTLCSSIGTTRNQLKMFLTRMGVSAKFVVTGDMSQIDLPRRADSGLIHAFHILKDIKGIAFVQFNADDIVRHRLVKEIVNAYNRAEETEPTRENKEPKK